METLILALLSGIGFVIAYNTYGKWLGSKVFGLSAQALCPSRRLEDGVDYVPTSKEVVFGHHFTSIAGTGPIVGPAIAIMWGWLPALVWVLFGSVFIGAVHDFGALVVSLRNNGQTVGDIAGRVLNKRVRLLFLFILFMALTIVLAIFGLVIAAVFKQYPASIFPCLIQIPLALGIGMILYKKGFGLLIPSLSALTIMYLTVVFGDRGWLHGFNLALAGWSMWTWVVVLLVYSYVASVLPVWSLLQPRDYINSLQLITALILVVLGLVVAALLGGAPLQDGSRPALDLVAPAIQLQPAGAPIVFPFLFITIACGAISGFHCLVSSGTSSKQLESETDARFVGYGSMLLEAFLAVLVILACAAGIGLGAAHLESGEILTGKAAWASRYASWGAADSLAAKVGAFVDGSANFLKSMGLATHVSIAIMGVLVASFAGTTMDTACRLQRYVIQELAGTAMRGSSVSWLGWLRNKHGATLFAVTIAALLAAAPLPGQVWSLDNAGKGGLLLWPLFGATNQLLGGLAFLVITFHLWRRGKPVWFLAIPMVFMLIMPFWALFLQLFTDFGGGQSWVRLGEGQGPRVANPVMVLIALMTLALEIWMVVEAFLLFPKVKGIIEKDAVDASLTGLKADAVKGATS